jgi:lysozyme family protein
MTSDPNSDPLFQQAVAIVLRHEGGYVDDPADPGGETKFGISRRSYPDLDIAALTSGEAEAIYYRDWWLPHRYGELPAAVACKVFDLAVNLGARTVVTLLQGACVACGQDIAVDGVLGDRTLAAADACDPGALLGAVKRAAADHYRTIAAGRPVLRKYLAGWLARAEE